MKVLKKSMLLLLIVLAAIVSSCSSDDDNNGPSGSGNGDNFFTAKVDGEAFRSLSDEAYGGLTVIENNSVIVVSGGDNQGRGISISVERFNGVGEYDLFNLDNTLGLGMYMEGEDENTQIWNGPIEGQIGKLKVTSITDNRMKGTFHFKVLNIQTNTVKSITEGNFNVPYATVAF